MMKRFARCVLDGTFLILVVGFATAAAAASAPDSYASDEARSVRGASDTAPLPMVFPGVWYRTPEKRGKISAWLARGDLTIGADTIAFESKKIKVSIPTASIRDVVSTAFRDDLANTWIVIAYDEGGTPRSAAFKGARLGRETEAIRLAAQSAWLTGAPEPPTEPTKAEIDSAIDNLHTTRVESLTYSNRTVPKNVWRLVFTPGIDDALLRAYGAGDPDDLFRFNLIMILNRRALDLDTEEHRRQVYDCMIGALHNDSFEWVKVEARDALRRLGAGKDVLREADALIEDARRARAQPPPARPQAVSTTQGDPLSQLAGEWHLTVFVIGGGHFGGPICGKTDQPGPPSIAVASPADGGVSFTVACNDGSDYAFLLKHDAASGDYLITVKSKVGTSVDGFPVAYLEGQGWKGARTQRVDGNEVSVTSVVAPIEGRNWSGWMIAVMPTADIDLGPDDVKTPYFRADLTRRK